MATPTKDRKALMGRPISTTATIAAATAVASALNAQGSGTIKVGLLGCGGRGSGAIRQSLQAHPCVEVVAMADLFESKARSARDRLQKEEKFQGRVNVDDDHLFWGFDCHEKLAKTDADLLVMATAPAFRGRQMMAAIKAGKHVFTEKPVATDPAGCRLVIEASDLAKKKGLAIVCGTQRRHEFKRVELMKRIHDGAIGELVGGQCYWIGKGIWYRGEEQIEEGMSELEWQCRNWYHFTWLSGDQICEQHIHNIDVMNWCFNGPPVKFTALGGRGCRDYSVDAKKVCKHFNNGSERGWKKYDGDIYDHIFAEFEYPNGARCLSASGHGSGTTRQGEKIVGTKGTSNCSSGFVAGSKKWEFEGENVNGQQQEHIDMIESIQAGEPLNEGRRIAESTLTAIGARMSAYTGRTFSWDWLMNSSKLDLVPPDERLVPGPGVFHPIANGAERLI